MILTMFTIILTYVIDIFLVAVTFYSLKERFQWKLTPKACLFILFIAFAFLENYFLPALYVLDITFTVRNEAIAKAFNLTPNMPFISIFGFGWFEVIILGIKSLSANYIGEKLLGQKSIWDNISKRKEL